MNQFNSNSNIFQGFTTFLFNRPKFGKFKRTVAGIKFTVTISKDDLPGNVLVSLDIPLLYYGIVRSSNPSTFEMNDLFKNSDTEYLIFSPSYPNQITIDIFGPGEILTPEMSNTTDIVIKDEPFWKTLKPNKTVIKEITVLDGLKFNMQIIKGTFGTMKYHIENPYKDVWINGQNGSASGEIQRRQLSLTFGYEKDKSKYVKEFNQKKSDEKVIQITIFCILIIHLLAMFLIIRKKYNDS